MASGLLRPFVNILGAACLLGAGQARCSAAEPRAVLVELDSEESLAGWSSVDDRVMGGVSRSRVEQAASNSVRFAGELSLEQGGGFASIRRQLGSGRDLSPWEGLALRVRGDGRAYQLRIRTDGEYDGIAYSAAFATRAGEWIDVRLPFDALVPTWRGRRLSDVPPLDPRRVRSIGFMVSGDQAGFFELEIARLETYGSGRSESE